MANLPPIDVDRIELAAKAARILQTMERAKSNNPVMNGLASGVTLAAYNSTSQPAGYTLLNVVSSTPRMTDVCNLLGAAWTNNGTAMVPQTVTWSGGFAYSGCVEVATYDTQILFGIYDSSITALVTVDDGSGEKFVSAKTTFTFAGSGSTQYLEVSGLASGQSKIVRLYSASKIRFIGYKNGIIPWPPAVADVIKLYGTGDSYTAGSTGAGTSDPMQSFFNFSCKMLGVRDGRASGIGGTGYLNNAGTKITAGQHLMDIDGADIGAFITCYNDANSAAYPVANVVAEAVRCWNAFLSANPYAFLIACGSWAPMTGPSTDILNLENALATALAGLNSPRAAFIRISTAPSGAWVNSGNAALFISPTDNVHPTAAAGHPYLGRDRLTSAIRNAMMQIRNQLVSI